MAVNVVVPAVGESVQEGMIHKWHKKDGDIVNRDDVLLELETDKATVEIVAEVGGAIKLLKKQGETVKVGDVLASIDTDAKASASAAPVASTPAPQSSGAAPAAKVEKAQGAEMPLSPAVNRMVHEQNLDPKQIEATGKGGRITKGDVVQHLEKATSKPVSHSASTPVVSVVATSSRTVRREPMTMLRRRIAERLLQAQETNAILTTFNEVDMSAIMEIRAQYKDKFKEKHGVGLGFMSFFVSATIQALKSFPLVNGYIDGTDLVYHDYYDIGVAISTDRGLMVPVIRDADKLSFAGIESAIVQYAEKARGGKISVDDLNGGTFTITNGGVFGSLLSTPIINPPQSAILGMHKIQDRPMAIKGQVVIRPMMYLAMSYDHRIIDGKEAVSFLVKIKDCLEDPSRLLLGV
jgi:2-oxoglutarate dehydrogenase E2 component (dihydrolipoamide succinyltransferase)